MGFRPRPATWLRPRRRFSKPWIRRELVRAAAAQQRRKKQVQRKQNARSFRANQKKGFFSRLFGL